MSPEKRLQLLVGGSLCMLLGLGLRLWQLTVLQHAEHARTALTRQRRVEVIPPRRGQLLARDGSPLAIDLPAHDVAIDLPELDGSLDVVTPLARAAGIERHEALALVRGARARAGGDPGSLALAVIPLERAEAARRVLRVVPWLEMLVTEDGLHVRIDPAAFQERARTLEKLAGLVGRPRAELEAAVDAAIDRIHAIGKRDDRVLLWQRPVVVLPDAPFEVMARVSERAFELPGVLVQVRYARRYPQGPVAAHVIGTCGWATEAEQEAEKDRVLDGDRLALGLLTGERTEVEEGWRLREARRGRSGSERSAEARLAGTPGARLLVKDARNHTRRVLLDQAPRDGRDVTLSLDLALQAAVEEALDRAVLSHGDPASGGAACVIDLENGDLLALASSPRYDPNLLGQGFEQLLRDPRKPLLHRAVLAFAPGSTWKALSAFAITDPELGKLGAGWHTTCQGSLALGKHRFACDGVHGDVELVEALERSCNVYFFRAADTVGIDPLAAWADRLGLGRRFERGIPGEHAGLIPRPGSKHRRAASAATAFLFWSQEMALSRGDGERAEVVRRRLERARWWLEATSGDLELRPGDVRNAIIGQGDVLANPIQVAHLAAVVATGGRAPTPRLDLAAPLEVNEVALDHRVLEKVREGMRRCVTRGTASKPEMQLQGLEVAGKTGTAERNARAGMAHQAWFMGYYPASAPRIAFAVLVDRTRGHGGEVCAPVAGALVRAWKEKR